MNIARFVFNPIQENTYVVWDATGECAVIDAGNLSAREDNALVNFITEHKLRPVLALNTHGHFDHIAGVEFLRTTYDIPFAMSGKDAFLLGAAASSARMYGVEVREAPAKIDRDLDSLTEIGFGDTRFEIIATPGHTPGHVSFYEPQSKTLFTGDTLFRESIGRTDLPGGDVDHAVDHREDPAARRRDEGISRPRRPDHHRARVALQPLHRRGPQQRGKLPGLTKNFRGDGSVSSPFTS